MYEIQRRTTKIASLVIHETAIYKCLSSNSRKRCYKYNVCSFNCNLRNMFVLRKFMFRDTNPFLPQKFKRAWRRFANQLPWIVVSWAVHYLESPHLYDCQYSLLTLSLWVQLQILLIRVMNALINNIYR